MPSRRPLRLKRTPARLTPQRQLELRSFGRRRGRKLSARQQRLLDEVLPRLASIQRAGERSPPTDLFSAPVSRDLAGDRLWRRRAPPLAGAGQSGCRPDRLRAVRGRRRQGAVGDRGAGARQRPPQHRRRARAAARLPRRLPRPGLHAVSRPLAEEAARQAPAVNRALADLLARVMQPGAELRIATDIGDYATHDPALSARPSGLQLAGYKAPPTGADAARLAPTRYEAKAGREGRRCYYFALCRGLEAP